MTPDPTAEAVRAARRTADDLRYINMAGKQGEFLSSRDIETITLAALSAFTAAQLAGAGEVEIAARYRRIVTGQRYPHQLPSSVIEIIDDVGVLLSTIATLRARCAELEEGLRPFARAASELHPECPDTMLCVVAATNGGIMTNKEFMHVRDLRRAAQLTKGKKDD